MASRRRGTVVNGRTARSAKYKVSDAFVEGVAERVRSTQLRERNISVAEVVPDDIEIEAKLARSKIRLWRHRTRVYVFPFVSVAVGGQFNRAQLSSCGSAQHRCFKTLKKLCSKNH